jgi:coenzyme Q-binding protein COQ10
MFKTNNKVRRKAMTILERSIIINAAPEKIEAVTGDGNRLPEWYAGIQKAEPDATYPEAGGAIDVVYKAAGISFKMKLTSLEYISAQKISLKMEGMITGTNQWIYTPEGSGTRVTASLDYEMPGGGIGQAINKLVVERMNAENLEKSLQKLKTVVEGA